MANQKHLDILKQGVKMWNQWRQVHPDILPDLSGANLFRADLWGVNLSRANLSEAYLNRVAFNRGDLRGIDFSEANLCGADFSEAYLNDACLSKADLSGANFNRTDLSGADFSKTKMFITNLGNVNLQDVKGLETVEHQGPSSISIVTMYLSHGNIPETFLQKAGVPDSFITYARALVGRATAYFSCFISYSSQDEAFVKRLYADLQSNNVRCWFAPEDLKIGDKLRPSIDESIYLYDKLLLVLSQHSIASQWVEQEVETALTKERKEQRLVLFPVRLDNTTMEHEGGWPALVRNTRNIGNFTHWKRHDAYQKALERLLRDLKAET